MNEQLPVIIQGGMGVGVSSWQLAREVSQAGQLGVVSGTALDAVLARKLQNGDVGGHCQRAMEHFPSPPMAQRVLDKYFRPDGRGGAPYRPNPTLTVQPGREAMELALVGNFVETWLAKEGHDGVVGINCLEKIQVATASAALGAMLAGADFMLMGAGIPREIPRLLRDLEAGRPGRITIDVYGGSQPYHQVVDPVDLLGEYLPQLRRPKFLAIISVHSLASYLYRDEDIRPDGFVVEGPVAGGHSAPPRGKMQLDEQGEPIYGSRDMADVPKIAQVGLPFWMAGAYGTPERVAEARAAGAQGVQSGTLFALSAESGLAPWVKERMIAQLADGTLHVRNDPRASPTGFPFKIAEVPGTLSQPEEYAARPRLCDLSYLRQPYERVDGSLGYRCASEPGDPYLRKGGVEEDMAGRMCLCNGLMANIGLGQERKDGYAELPAVTLGQDLDGAKRLIARHPGGWRAQDALDFLLAETSSDPTA